MRPIYQTKFGDEGNCWAACLASLLELDIEDVPDFSQYSNWIGETNKWLHQFGIRMTVQGNPQWYPVNAFYIAWGKSPRGLEHSVIYWNGELHHDPHPDNGGVEVSEIAYFVRTFT